MLASCVWESSSVTALYTTVTSSRRSSARLASRSLTRSSSGDRRRAPAEEAQQEGGALEAEEGQTPVVSWLRLDNALELGPGQQKHLHRGERDHAGDKLPSAQSSLLPEPEAPPADVQEILLVFPHAGNAHHSAVEDAHQTQGEFALPLDELSLREPAQDRPAQDLLLELAGQATEPPPPLRKIQIAFRFLSSVASPCSPTRAASLVRQARVPGVSPKPCGRGGAYLSSG